MGGLAGSGTIFAAASAAFVACAVALSLLKIALPARVLAAKVTGRSNHTQPARQIGGLAVVPAAAGMAWLFSTPAATLPFMLLAAVALAFLIGLVDDAADLPALAKTAGLSLVVALALLALAAAGPPWPRAGALGTFGLAITGFLLFYWVNATNFMDGLDLMTAAGAGIPLLYLSTWLLAGAAQIEPIALLGLAFAGALGGFALFNRPPAAVFLGDSGSLPLGLVSGCVIALAAARLPITAAILPVLYYAGDTLSTIVLRLRDGENIFRAHSRHAYQVARRAGMSSNAVVARVSALTILLCGLSAIAALSASAMASALCMAAGLAATAWLIVRFRRMEAPVATAS